MRVRGAKSSLPVPGPHSHELKGDTKGAKNDIQRLKQRARDRLAEIDLHEATKAYCQIGVRAPRDRVRSQRLLRRCGADVRATRVPNGAVFGPPEASAGPAVGVCRPPDTRKPRS